MKIEEVFSLWKERVADDPRVRCIYSQLTGGPGFFGFGNCSYRPEITYGTPCPKGCSNFIQKSDNELFCTFLQLYYHSKNWYNKTYEIDEDDPYYIS